MKKIVSIIILTLYVILVSAQINNDSINKLIISYSGDSTLFVEKYELDLKKEKIYYITPMMNCLDIKGEKYRTRIKIKTQYWEEIQEMINSLNSLKTKENEKKKEGKIIYSIKFLKDNSEIKNYEFYTEVIPIEVKGLFEIIRNKK